MMSVKVHESFSIDSFQDRLLWWDDFLGDQIKDEWTSGGSAGGSAVVVDAQTGGIVRLTTDNDANDSWTLNWNTIRSLHVNNKITMEVRCKITDVTNVAIQLMLRFDGNNQIYFRFNTGLLANWVLISIDGGAATTPDSGVTPDTDYHIYRIECFPTGEVHFYIDGVECGNSPITTNIPDDAGDYLQPQIYIETLAAASKSLDIDYVALRQEI